MEAGVKDGESQGQGSGCRGCVSEGSGQECEVKVMVVEVRLRVKYIEVGSSEVSGHVRSVAVRGRDKWGQVPEHQEHEIRGVAWHRGQSRQVPHLMNWLYRPAVL